MKPLVIGIGNRWRGDDGLGPAAVDAIGRRVGGRLDLLALDGEPGRLVDAWRDRARVWVIDAIRTGAAPGTIHRCDALEGEIPGTSATSSHAAGVRTAVELGRVLGCLPERLVILGVEPGAVDHGAGLSPEVETALATLVRLLEDEVRAACA